MKRDSAKQRRAGPICVLAIMEPGEERERLSTSAAGEAWTVEFCVSLAEAVEVLRSARTFAAVVLDRDVPGIQWEPTVRELASRTVARILLASAGCRDGLWESVVEHGGHDVLSKPLRPDEVRRAILHAHWYATTLQFPSARSLSR